MNNRICIPKNEYADRVKCAADLIAKQGFDVLVANSNEV